MGSAQSQAIGKRLKSIIEKMNVYPNVANLKNTDNLFTSGAMDSLILIQFVLAVEDEFKIRLANEDIHYEQFQSFDRISELLKTKYGQK